MSYGTNRRPDPGKIGGSGNAGDFNIEGTWLCSDGSEALIFEQQKMTSGVQEYMCRINMANGTRGTMRTMNSQKTVMRILAGKTSRGTLADNVMTWKDGTTWTLMSAERSRSAPPFGAAPQQKVDRKTMQKPNLDWDHVLNKPKNGGTTPEAGDTRQNTNQHIIKIENQTDAPPMVNKKSKTKKPDGVTPVEVELGVVSSNSPTYGGPDAVPESPKSAIYDTWSNLEMQAAEQTMYLEELIEENAQYSGYLKSQVADQSLGNVDFEGATVRQKEIYRILDNLETQRKKIDREVDEPELLEAALQNRNLMLNKMKEYAQGISDAVTNKDGAEMARKEERYEMAYFDLMELNKVIANYEFERVKQYKAKIEFAEKFYDKDKTYDEFKKFWLKVFGVKLQELLFEDCMMGYNLLEEDKRKQMVTFEMFLMFLAHEHEVESAAEALNLIKDNQRMAAHFEQERYKTRKLCFFVFLWISLLIYLVVHQGGTQYRYLQTKGVRQVLFETIENDHQFEHTTNVGLMWIFLKKVLVPFLYGTKEYMSFGEGETDISGYTDEGGEFGIQQAVNPYLLGGVRLRQIRLKGKDCSNIGSGNDYFRCTEAREYDESDWTLAEDDVIQWQSKSDLDEQTYEYPWTTTYFQGSGYAVDLAPFNDYTLCPSVDDDGNMPDDAPEGCAEHCTVWAAGDGWDEGGAVPLAQCKVLARLQDLHDKMFVDDKTRVLFIDFNLYNPSQELHTVARLQFEFALGTVYPSMNIATVNFFAWKNEGAYFFQFGFIALSAVFVLLHMAEMLFNMRVLGGPAWFPACCGCPNDGKIPVHLSKHEMLLSGKNTLSFMEWNPSQGVLKLALGKTTGLRVMLSQENLTRMVQRSLERIVCKDKPAGSIKVTKVTPDATDHGGVDVLLDISGLPEQSLEHKKQSSRRRNKRSKNKEKGGFCKKAVYPVGHLTFEEHEKVIFRLLAEDLEANLDTDQYLQAAVVLVRRDLTGKDFIFGNGITILYSSFWSLLDLLLCILLIIFIVWDTVSFFNIDEDELVQVDKFKSFRAIYYNYEWELLICFMVTWCATLKLIQALMSINKHVSMFWSMLKKSSGHLLNFLVLLFVIVLTFAMSGWALFSGQLEEFRTIPWTIYNLLNFTFDSLFFEEVIHASFLGIIYYVAWGVLMPFILINVFIAILMTAWDETVTEHDLSSMSPENNNKKRGLLAKLFPFFENKVVEGDIQKMGPQASLTDPKHWRKVYPAGCPKRKLMSYLEQQLGIKPEDAEQIIRFVDTDDSGTFEWHELNDALKNLKPSLENSLIPMTRLQTKTLRKEQLLLKEHLEKVTGKLENMAPEDQAQNDTGMTMKEQIEMLNQKIDTLTDLTASIMRQV